MLPFPIISNTHVIPTSDIKKISCTQDVLYVLYNNGNLYTMGSNQYGTYGTGKSLTSNGGGAFATSTWTLSKTGVQDVWGGSGCAVLLLNTGVYQYCGLARLLGTTNDTSTIALTWTNFTAVNTFITNNSSLTVKKVHVGGQAIGMLMSNDSLYMMGYNSQGGFGSNTQQLTAMSLCRTNVKDFICGSILTMLIDKTNNEIYRAGWNISGQLGTGGTASITAWTSTSAFGTALWATQNATYYIDTGGTLYGSGEYTAGQLDNGINTIASTGNFRTTYVSVMAGVASNAFVGNSTADSTLQSYAAFKVSTDLYIIGQNLSGQQGNGTTGNSATFTKTVLPSGYNSGSVLGYLQIGLTPGNNNTSAGGDGSAVGYMLTNDGKLWCCGDYRYYTSLTGLTSNQSSWTLLPKPE
jgi:alpha-tubulin suppressor-like RCC1 family protein